MKNISVKLISSASAGVILLGAVGVGSAPVTYAQEVSVQQAGETLNVQNKQQILDTFKYINDFRIKNGLEPVNFNATASEVSEDWSDQMAATRTFAHNPNYNKDPRVANRSPYAAEIIAARWDTNAQGLVVQWENSPSHNEIMSDPDLKTIGIGITVTGNQDWTNDPFNYTMFGTVNFYNFTNPPAGQYNNPQDFFDGKPALNETPITSVATVAPGFDDNTGKYTVPAVTGVDYYVDSVKVAAGTYDSGWKSVLVEARAQSGYKLSGDTSWTHNFVKPATPVTATAPTFDLKTGKYTIPTTDGVDYSVDGAVKPAGVYDSGWQSVTVTAAAKAGYALSGTATWTGDFVKPATPVTATAPTFDLKAGKYTIPTTDGVDYSVDGVIKPAGVYDSGWKTVTVKAIAKEGFALNGLTSWTGNFVAPAPIVAVSTVNPGFSSKTGQYTVPAKAGIQYFVNGVAKNAGTYNSDWVKIDITAQPKEGYSLTGITAWSYTFVKPATPSIKNTGDIIAADEAGRLWNYGVNGTSKILLGSSGWQNMQQIRIADWNSDGIMDIVAQDNTGKLHVYKGNKYGGFTRVTVGLSDWQNYEIDVAKWKSTDKFPGVLARENSTGNLYYYANTSGNALGSRIEVGKGFETSNINLLDWDKDGKLDMIVKNAAGQLVLHRGTGTGMIVNETRKTISAGWNGFNTIQAIHGLAGANTTGLLARDSVGNLYYYGATKGAWVPRVKVGANWSALNIAGR